MYEDVNRIFGVKSFERRVDESSYRWYGKAGCVADDRQVEMIRRSTRRGRPREKWTDAVSELIRSRGI